MRELLFVALILACPLMMIWMMRGHGHGHGGFTHGGHGNANEHPSIDELRRRRNQLDRLEEREVDESPAPVGGRTAMSATKATGDAAAHDRSR